LVLAHSYYCFSQKHPVFSTHYQQNDLSWVLLVLYSLMQSHGNADNYY